MSRLTFDDLTPEDMPAPFEDDGHKGDSHMDSNPKQAPWSRAEVMAYRMALEHLPYTREQVDEIIRKDCGPEHVVTGMLLRKQAGG